ncbi:MAG: nitroreductase family protein [Candidatus Bathyarchaeota archaeon]
MDVLEAIKTRRSVRRFKTTPVNADLILRIIDAARYSPSSRNRQPWEFVIIRTQDVKRKLSQIHEFSWPVREAPVSVLVLGNQKLSARRVPQDCSCAIQNMWLAAHSFGIGCCWVAVHSTEDYIIEEKVKEILPIPENYRVIAIIAMGYPDEKPDQKDLKSLEELIHWEEFQCTSSRKF